MNEVQAELKLYVLQETDFDVNEYITKFNESNIVNVKLEITLSDGSVHKTSICEMLDGVIKSFIIDGEEKITKDMNKKERIAKRSDLAIKKLSNIYTNII
jgi:hypothetical protein